MACQQKEEKKPLVSECSGHLVESAPRRIDAAASADGAPSDGVTADRIQARPVINFNERSKTRGQSLNFSLLLELIPCLTRLDSGEPNLPGSSKKELTAAHLFLVEVITAEPFLAAVKHTILGSFFGGVRRCIFFKGT